MAWAGVVGVVAMELSDLVTVDVEQVASPAVAVVRVRGELDFGTTPRLVEAIADLPAPGQQLVFDLSGLEFCDSSGLGALIAAHKVAAGRGSELYLTGVMPAVMTAITVTALDQLFRIRDDVATVYAELMRL
jgi:anti-anti-sigma factor